jgi:hypothetical protein
MSFFPALETGVTIGRLLLRQRRQARSSIITRTE